MNSNLKIVTWNINGLIGKNLSGQFAEKSAIDIIQESNEKYGSALKKIGPDFICLQEVHSMGNTYSQTKDIAEIAEFKYFKELPLDDSHHIKKKNLKIGISIISRHEIIESKINLLTNPNIEVQKKNEVWKSHDKGFISIKINIPPIGDVNIISIHLLPFHRFNIDINDYRIIKCWKELDYMLSNYSNGLTIIGGDFNRNNVSSLLKGLFNNHHFQDVNFEKTTHRATFFDHIIISNNLHIINKKVFDNFDYSDHYPCFAEVEYNQIS